jgi:hypothetical protein
MDKLGSTLMGYLAVIGVAFGIFYGGRMYERSTYRADTTYVTVPLPMVGPPAIVTTTPATTTPPETQWHTQIVVDTAQFVHFQAIADSVIREKDSLQARLVRLYEPKYGVSQFANRELAPGFQVSGEIVQSYAPLREQFTSDIKFTKITFPEITKTQVHSWWVKPAIFLGGALTYHFATHNSNDAALITAGASTILIIWEF